MQVSVEKTSEISRKMTVSVPDDVVQEKVSARLKSLARNVKVDGFRPGKVPVQVVKKMYGDQAKNEVAGDLIESTYKEAIKDQALQPTGYPQILSTDYGADGFKYVAEFEVYPDVSLAGIADIAVTRPSAQIEPSDFENMLTKLRIQQKTWHEVERAAAEADRVYINFSGVVDGENISDGKTENFPVEIGSKKMLADFEDNLMGLAAGDQKTFEITFPEDYGNKKLAGKQAEFSVEVLKVEEGALPEIDAALAQTYGIENGDVEAFKEGVRENMQRELRSALHEKLKTAVMDALYSTIHVELPNSLINAEIQNLLQPYVESAKQQNMKPEDLKLPKELFVAQAKRRVALGLILNKIIHENNFTVNAEKVRETLNELAQGYENPTQVVNWYYEDKGRLADVEQLVLEDLAVAWIVDQAQVIDQTISFDAAMSKEPENTVES